MISMTFIFKIAPFGLSGAFWSMMISLAIFIGVSLVTKPQAHTASVVDSLNNFFAEEDEPEKQTVPGNLVAD